MNLEYFAIDSQVCDAALSCIYELFIQYLDFFNWNLHAFS